MLLGTFNISHKSEPIEQKMEVAAAPVNSRSVQYMCVQYICIHYNEHVNVVCGEYVVK